MSMRQVLRWKYSLTTIQQNFPWFFFKFFLKVIIIDKYQAIFLGFPPIFSLADLASKKLFQNFGRLYLGQMWGPDTHDDPHETGAQLSIVSKSLIRGGYTEKVCCICWYSFVMAYIKQLCNNKKIVVVKIGPPTGQIKKGQFSRFCSFSLIVVFALCPFSNTYWHLVFTDLLVTTLWVCEHPTYL